MTAAAARHDATAAAVVPASSDTTWLAGLTARHRQFFDAPAPAGGIPLVHVMNYYDTYNGSFGVKDRDVNAVLTLYGSTTFMGLDDAMWAKYHLGGVVSEKDSAGKPVLVNPWRTAPVILGNAMPSASIEALQRRGARFILCNNALGIFSGIVARQHGLDPAAVYADMKGHLLPGVKLVPAMVIAVEQAHAAGLSYHRQ